MNNLNEKVEKFFDEFPTLAYEGTTAEDKGRYFRVNIQNNLIFDIVRIKDKVHIRLVDGFYKWQNGLKFKLDYDIYTITWLYHVTGWGNTYNDEYPIGAWLTRKFLRWHDEEDFATNCSEFLWYALGDVGLVNCYGGDDGWRELYKKFWYPYGKTFDDFKIIAEGE